MPEDIFPNPWMNPFIEKGKKTWEVSSDIDVWFEYFIRPRNEVPEGEVSGISLEVIRWKVRELEGRLDRHLDVYYRRSAHGRTHVKVVFHEPIRILSCFLIQSHLFNDPLRQNLDQSRFAVRNSLETMNKCFDYKIDSEGMVQSGPWIPLNKGRDDLTGEAKRDWERYWQSIGREYHKGENHQRLIREHFKELPKDQREETVKALLTVMVKEIDEQTELTAE